MITHPFCRRASRGDRYRARPRGFECYGYPIVRIGLAALLALALIHCGSSGQRTVVDAAADAGGTSQTGGPDGATRPSGDGSAPSDGGSRTDGSDAAILEVDGGTVQGTTVGFFVGVNGLITDSVANLAPIGVVREYHNWGWLGNNYDDKAYPQTLYTPNIPDFGWDWDGFFSGLKARGVSGFPAVQGGVPWVNSQAVPPAEGSPTAAASYLAHGDTMFQIAARWGSAKVPDAKLKLESGQTRSSGLGTVEYFEDFNEEDNAKGFTGDVFAAMASADYDGDQTRLGATIGVKNADPSAKLVMGGLSGAYGKGDTWINSITAFLDAARAWSAANRGRKLPGRRDQRALLQLRARRPGSGPQPGRRRRPVEARGGCRLSRSAPAGKARVVDRVRLRHVCELASPRAGARTELGVRRTRTVAGS